MKYIILLSLMFVLFFENHISLPIRLQRSLWMQEHILLFSDENDKIIRPAIYWSDSRSAKQAEELSVYYDKIMKLSYNAPSPCLDTAADYVAP